MKIKIPENNYRQDNRSDVLGNLWASYCIDLQSNVGRLRISPRLKLNKEVVGLPVAFKHFSALQYAICGSTIYYLSGDNLDGTQFTEDNSTNAQTDYTSDESDMEVFNSTLCATTTDGLFSLDTGAGTWTSRDTLNSGTPHMMTYFQKYNRLYYTNQSNKIISIDSSWSTADPGVDYAITINSSSGTPILTCLKATTQDIWIGARSANSPMGGGDILFRWDGLSNQVTKAFKIPNARSICAIAIDPVKDVPYVMDSNGILHVFNGSGFTEVGRLPFGKQIPFGIGDIDNDRFIHPNGMIFTDNGTIRVNINPISNISGDNAPENLPAGVWEWSEANGFVHINSVSYNPISSSTITDYGQSIVTRAGAIAMILDAYTTSGDGTMLVGAGYSDHSNSDTNGIFIDNTLDTIQKTGYFVTSRIFSDEVEDIWNDIYLRHKLLQDSSDAITIKYRTSIAEHIQISVSWQNPGVFQTTTDLDSYEGYEVEILQGKGAGQCLHISQVTNDGGIRTVVMEEDFNGVFDGTTVNATSVIRIQNWQKLETQTDQNLNWFRTGISSPSTWVQFKVYAIFTGENEIDDLTIFNKHHQNLS